MSNSSTVSKLEALSGLESAKKAVVRIAGGETGVHAVLLYGAPGSGKNELAKILTQAWLCKNLQPDGACGECRPCIAFERDQNADVLNVFPQGLSSIIRIGQITPRETDKEHISVQEFLRTPPIIGRNKIVLIQSADRMNSDAANALLKTLEEPHPHAKLVLTTSTVGLILPTILSRCLAISCELPRDADRKQQAGVTETDWRLAQGAPGRAKELAEAGDIYHAIDALARSIPARGPEAALSTTEEFRKLAEKLEKHRDCGMRAANTEALAVFAISISQLNPPNPHWGREAAEAHRRILGNGNAGLVLDALFSSMLTVR